MKNIQEIIDAINSCQSCDEIRDVINRVDELWRAGEIVLADEDWPKISSAVAKRKAIVEHSQHRNLMSRCADYYQLQLRTHPQKMEAITYLQNRGLDGRTAKIFGIGYAPPGWQNIIEQESSIELLSECGMVIHGDTNIYDRFRNRIMFPIHNVSGHVIGFGGRVLNDDKPKYLNSPETAIFHKSDELYGLYQAIASNGNTLDRLLVVEGNMDVVSLHQFGITYAAATMGTACGTTHLLKAFRYTNEIIFCFDGDKAGLSAARRALDAAIQVINDNRAVKFMFLPSNEDPDSLVRKIGKDAFQALIDHAMPLVNYILWLSSEGLDIGTIEGKALSIKRAAQIACNMPPCCHMDNLLAQLSVISGLPVQNIVDLAFTNSKN